MIKEKIRFVQKANKFIVHYDNGSEEFNDYAEAATFYNQHLHTDKYVEISAVYGIVGVTLAWHQKED